MENPIEEHGGDMLADRVVHHFADVPEGEIPYKFLCGETPQTISRWSKYRWLVDCPACIESREAAAIARAKAKDGS